LLSGFDIKAVYTNRDYEPKAIMRDKKVSEFFTFQQCRINHSKDQVIFERIDFLNSL